MLYRFLRAFFVNIRTQVSKYMNIFGDFVTNGSGLKISFQMLINCEAEEDFFSLTFDYRVFNFQTTTRVHTYWLFSSAGQNMMGFALIQR